MEDLLSSCFRSSCIPLNSFSASWVFLCSSSANRRQPSAKRYCIISHSHCLVSSSFRHQYSRGYEDGVMHEWHTGSGCENANVLLSMGLQWTSPLQSVVSMNHFLDHKGGSFNRYKNFEQSTVHFKAKYKPGQFFYWWKCSVWRYDYPICGAQLVACIWQSSD